MILALHGNLGSRADWEDLGIPGLRALDLWKYSHLTFEQFADDISQTADRPVLAGYSLGGRLALHAMAMHPERWRGAVVLSAHPGLVSVADREARRAADGLWAERVREWRWSEFLARWNSQEVLADSPVADGQPALESDREAVARAFEGWSLGKQKDLRNGLRAFDKPVLWISGERDTKFTVIGREMSDVFSDFRHETVRDCGHRVLGKVSARMIREFVSRLS